LAVGCWSSAGKKSPRFEAGSVVKRMVGLALAKCSAAAMEIVVFPTPPFPPIRRMRRSRELNASANGKRPAANESLSVAGVNPYAALFLIAISGVVAGHLLLARANVAQRLEDLFLLLRILRLGDVAHFEHHLQLDQTLFPRLIVEQLLIGHGLNLAENP